jgi:hypothetical protein
VCIGIFGPGESFTDQGSQTLLGGSSPHLPHVQHSATSVQEKNHVGFEKITAREMLDHLFLTYEKITAVDVEKNCEKMSEAWDPQQPVETLSIKFKIVLTSWK